MLNMKLVAQAWDKSKYSSLLDYSIYARARIKLFSVQIFCAIFPPWPNFVSSRLYLFSSSKSFALDLFPLHVKLTYACSNLCLPWIKEFYWWWQWKFTDDEHRTVIVLLIFPHEYLCYYLWTCYVFLSCFSISMSSWSFYFYHFKYWCSVLILSTLNMHFKNCLQETLLGPDWRNVKGQELAVGNSSKQPTRKQFMESTSLSDSKSTELSVNMSMDEVTSASIPSTSRAAEVTMTVFLFLFCRWHIFAFF